MVSKRKQIPKDSKNTETPETYRFFFGNFFHNSIRIEIKAEGPKHKEKRNVSKRFVKKRRIKKF